MFFASPLKINTLLLDMIPQAARSKAAMADSILGERNSRETVILAASTDFEKAKNAAILLHDELINSSGVDSVSLYFDPPLIAEFAEHLYTYRFVIAGKKTLELLETGNAGEIAMDALATAYGAFSLIPLDNIDRDPFLLTERRMGEFLSSSLLAGGSLGIKDDVLSTQKDGIWYIILRMTLFPEAVSVNEKNNTIRAIYTAAESIKENEPALELYFSGIPFHSYESASGAQREITIISSITLFFILLLFLFVFRSPIPVLFSIIDMLISLGMAASAVFLIFREIHIITFVFGTSLIGTCVDYSIHFFIHWKGNAALKNGNEIRSHISKSMIMCVVSSGICFFAVLFAPFPILKQFAVFSTIGLLSSFLTAYCIYPLLKVPVEEKRQFSFFKGNFFVKLTNIPMPPVFRIILVLVLAVICITILLVSPQGVKIKNDINSLYTMSPFLLESEKRAALVLDYGSTPWYFIVSGGSPEEVLENEEKLIQRLEEEISRENLKYFLGTSSFVPSINHQKKTYDSMKALLPLARSQFENLGFPPEYAESFYAEFAAGEIYCLPEDLPVQAGISNLWIGELQGNYFSCVLPFFPKNEDVFKSIAEEFDFVFFINKAEDISRDLDTLTRTIIMFFIAAYLVVAVIIFIVYPLSDALKICTVPVFFILAALTVLTLKGIPLGFFSIAALILVFGLGLDYIFYMTGNLAPRHEVQGTKCKVPLCGKHAEANILTPFAVFLSFTTTILSFGVLSFSSFAPVHIFGLTVSAGLGAAFISVMLLSGRKD